MMLPKITIDRFLHRRLDDHRAIKKYSADQVQAMADNLDVDPGIWDKLYDRQKRCFLLGLRQRRFAMFLDTGEGKSMIAMAVARQLAQWQQLHRALILVPNNVNRYEWQREVKKHANGERLAVAAGTRAAKLDLLFGDLPLFTVATYQGLTHALCTERKDRNGRVSWVPDLALVKRMTQQFDAIVLDESTQIGDHNSLYFRICRQLCKSATMVFALSATPFGRDPTQLWAQMFLVDRGETLGPNLTIYRDAFFKTKVHPYTGFPMYEFDPKKKAALNRTLAHRSIRYQASASDLPETIRIVKEVYLPTSVQDHYAAVKQELRAARGNPVLIQSAFIRLRQLSSGFIGYTDDLTGTKAKLEFPQQPKLEQLLALLQSLDPESKCIVFHEFIYSGMMICRELSKLKLPHVHARENIEAAVARFIDDPGIQVMVVNSAAGAFGGNWQISKYLVFYESSTSPIIRLQAERRVERQGSQHGRIYLYDLVTHGTVDQRILEFTAQGRDLLEAVLDNAAVLDGTGVPGAPDGKSS